MRLHLHLNVQIYKGVYNGCIAVYAYEHLCIILTSCCFQFACVAQPALACFIRVTIYLLIQP